jgi:hypothetical protein
MIYLQLVLLYSAQKSAGLELSHSSGNFKNDDRTGLPGFQPCSVVGSYSRRDLKHF